ncbi:hypothetical protein FDG09_01655 [Clostridium sporogenes]|uniref:hypothetical protein n=1 Tax=Clostridium sporogenes TaxID=1509 RepID=UPI0013D1478A|nr:hypothetical protein [Clostridium sporogenes]NFV11667.1 hypothetical protein [Clostridium sporogenes]
MIRDMTESFKKITKDINKVILDNYELKEGVYFRVSLDETFKEIDEENYIILRKKENQSADKTELINWFKERDYLSSILNDDTNKAIDLPDKKLHSSNYLTLFIKKDICPYIGIPKKSILKDKLQERLEKFFDSLLNCEKKFIQMIPKNSLKDRSKLEFQKEFLKTNFNEEMKHIKSDKRKKYIEKCREYFMNNLENILQYLKKFNEENKFNNYIKIFIDAPIEDYKIENKIYIKPRIFNVNDYNTLNNNVIMGLPSNDITTNSKKPYLLLRTTKYKVPYRDTMENVNITQNFYGWLKKKSKESNGEIRLEYDYGYNSKESYNGNKSFYLIHVNQDNEIDDFDNISKPIKNIDFVLENTLGIPRWDKNKKKYLKDKPQSDINIDKLSLLQKFVSNYFFNRNMYGYFKKNDPPIEINKFTMNMKISFMKSRDAFFDYFHKGIDTNLKSIINKVSMEIIEEEIKHTVQGIDLNRVRFAYNLRLSLLKSLKVKGGEKMASRMLQLIDDLKEKLKSDGNIYCENDDEFYFISGQLAYYILSQTESDKKTFGLFEPILLCKNSTQLKRKIVEILEIYKYAININAKLFKNSMAMIMDYETDTKIIGDMKDMLICGIMANNIFYQKNYNGNQNEEDENSDK